MINSILNRHKNPVRFDNIKTNNNLITEPDSIKQIIQNYFYNQTALRLVNFNIFNSNWTIEYTSKSNIQVNWYSNILQLILIDKV